MSGTSVQDALDAAQSARHALQDHQRAHRDSDPADTAIATRGGELLRLADEATAKHHDLQRTAQTAATTKRRDELLAQGAGLQGRLRAEAQARRDAAAAQSPPGPRAAKPR